MDRDLKVHKNTTAHEKAIIEILNSIKRTTANKEMVANIFQSAGIILDDQLSFISLSDDVETCARALMDNLSPLPLLRLKAKSILRNRGLICLIYPMELINPYESVL